MYLRLVVGASRLRESERSPEQSDEEFLFSDDAAEYYEGLVAGAQTVAEAFPFAAWAEPDDAPLYLGRVDGHTIVGLRWAAAVLASSGQVPVEIPAGNDIALFTHPVVTAAWDRGPEYVAVGRGGTGPAITGTERLAAFDHFLHHTGEPVVCSPVDFGPVVVDKSAPGSVLPSSCRLIAELRHLAGVLDTTSAAHDDHSRGVHALLTAAEIATTAGAALVMEYA
jgi:hypothetical protein